jgi:uncharacterized protein
MHDLAASIAIGFSSGVLSGMFGIGGGIITTPAIKLLLGAPALIAVGTPLPVILPTALTGAITYARSGIADVRAGVTCGIAGSLTAVLGAWSTQLVGGEVVLIATAVVIFYAAIDMGLQAFRTRPIEPELAEEIGVAPHPDAAASAPAPAANPLGPLVVIGAVTGLYSGFLGLGGGFVLVPLLTRWLGFSVKRAIATSLVAVTILSVPGTITHAYLGHIDWGIALALSLGVVPGAILGARLTLGASDRAVRLGFSALLIVVGVWLAGTELIGLIQ